MSAKVKLFKYYLQQKETSEMTINYISKFHRWRNDPSMFPQLFSKQGVFCGYMKFGIIGMTMYQYGKRLITRIYDSFQPPQHVHH